MVVGAAQPVSQMALLPNRNNRIEIGSSPFGLEPIAIADHITDLNEEIAVTLVTDFSGPCVTETRRQGCWS
jgi:hypothetical protein